MPKKQMHDNEVDMSVGDEGLFDGDETNELTEDDLFGDSQGLFEDVNLDDEETEQETPDVQANASTEESVAQETQGEEITPQAWPEESEEQEASDESPEAASFEGGNDPSLEVVGGDEEAPTEDVAPPKPKRKRKKTKAKVKAKPKKEAAQEYDGQLEHLYLANEELEHFGAAIINANEQLATWVVYGDHLYNIKSGTRYVRGK